MRKAQFRGMQQQALALGRWACRVQTVANDRVAQTRQVNTQLVAAARDGREADARLHERLVSCNHNVMCSRRLADCMINHLPWTIRPVADQRLIDRTLIVFDNARNDGNVVFFDKPPLERTIERALRVEASRKNHESGGFHIETVNDQCFGKFSLHASAEAVRLIWPTTGDGEQAAWLIGDEEGVVNHQSEVRRHKTDAVIRSRWRDISL